VAWANVLWATQVAFQLLLGTVFMFSSHIKMSRIFSSPEGTAEALDVEEAEALEEEAHPHPPDAPGPPPGA